MAGQPNSFLGKSFKVVDPDARLRDQDNLMAYVRGADGTFAKIAQGASVGVDQARLVNRGADGPLLFVRAIDHNGNPVGWTSSRNFEGKFVNETLAAMEAPSNDKKGANAAWIGGKFSRQLTLVPIIGARLQILYLSQDTLAPYFEMAAAATAANVTLAINSGFRCYREQEDLYDGYTRKLPGYNLAAKPGYSKHQNGIAFDIDVPGGAGNPCYDWMVVNATSHGFLRTVNKEPWHWEYDTARAATAKTAGTFKLDTVLI